MMLFTFHIVAIGVLVGVVGNFAYSLGKKNGLRIARMEQENAGEETATVSRDKF